MNEVRPLCGRREPLELAAAPVVVAAVRAALEEDPQRARTGVLRIFALGKSPARALEYYSAGMRAVCRK